MAVALVVGVAYAVKFAFLNQVGNVFYQLSLVYSIRYLRNDNLVVRLAALNFSLGTHHNAAAARSVSVAHALHAVNIGSRREVGRLYVLHKTVDIDVRVVYISATAVNHLAEIVRRNVSCHTYGYTIAAIDEQVGYLSRHDGRLLLRVVKVVSHVDRFLVKVVHDVFAHLR